MREVEIKIHSIIENLDDAGLATENVERENTTARGSFDYRLTGGTLEYDEESGGAKVHSILEVSGGRATLTKTGDINCKFSFISGEDTTALYTTGAFSFDVKINTKRLKYDATPASCSIRLIYSMNIGGQEKRVNLLLEALPVYKA